MVSLLSIPRPLTPFSTPVAIRDPVLPSSLPWSSLFLSSGVQERGVERPQKRRNIPHLPQAGGDTAMGRHPCPSVTPQWADIPVPLRSLPAGGHCTVTTPCHQPSPLIFPTAIRSIASSRTSDSQVDVSIAPDAGGDCLLLLISEEVCAPHNSHLPHQ